MRRTLAPALRGLGMLLLMLLPPTDVYRRAPGVPAAAAPFLSPLFERVWTRSDRPVAAGVASRSWTWGPGPGPVVAEPFAGAPGGARPVQYFDKGRMEVNPAVADPASPWAATSGLLVTELVSGRVQVGPDQFETRAPAEVPVAGDVAPADVSVPTYGSFAAVASLPGGPARRVPANRKQVVEVMTRDGVGGRPLARGWPVINVAYISETGHNIPDVFWSFMYSLGAVTVGESYQQRQLFDPVFVLGYPITEAYWATAIVDGAPTRVLIQLYQRRALTYVPGFAPAWQVQMGNVGQSYYRWRYGVPMPAATPVAVPPPPRPPADAFLRADGARLLLRGQPVMIKGTNYWLPGAPFVDTWASWDGPLAAKHLAQARALGVNSVRITLPYVYGPEQELVWGDKVSERVNGPITHLMTQLLQIAAAYDMKVMFVLFDGTDRVDDPDEDDARRYANYIQGIVAPFADDDRILAWDLKNEPDNGPVWKKGDPATSIAWMERMAAALRAADVHHPITVGMGQAANLWLAPEGRRVLDFVDFASFHSYDAGHLADEIAAVQAHTGKPIVLSEMGWPSGPAAQSNATRTFDEPTQQYLYETMLPAARAGGLAGVMQWTLYDYTRGTSYESYFGLLHADGVAKPAAATFRDAYPAPPLPSQTRSRLPLTTPGHEPEIGP